jgi:hypothetical protein
MSVYQFDDGCPTGDVFEVHMCDEINCPGIEVTTIKLGKCPEHGAQVNGDH